MSGEQADGTAPDAGVSSPPPSGAEIEIKFQADLPGLERVVAARQLQGAALSPERELVSVYFDTPERALQGAGLTLRVRRKGGSIPVLCAKWTDEAGGNLFARGEIEVRAPAGEPDIQLFEPAIRERLRQAIGDTRLVPIFRTEFRRRVAVVRHGRSQIELALDDGAIIANEQSRPLAEVELELKSGLVADLLNLANELARDCGLSLAFEPKSGRGYRLADKAAPRAQKAGPLDQPPDAGFDDMVGAIISNCLSHFTANWACLRESDAPESIHQLHVALRRLRSALAIFQESISLPEIQHLRISAHDIASALSPARACDAFLQNARNGPFRDQPDRLAAAAPLLEAVEVQRRTSYAAARHVIDDTATSLFVLDVQSFLVQRNWRRALPAGDNALLTSSARDFAAEVLDRLWRHAVRHGRHLSNMSGPERQELRAAVDNLHFVTEFSGSLFEDTKLQRRFRRVVTELRDDLGVQDAAAMAESFVATLDLGRDPKVQFAASYVLGYDRHGTLTADARLATSWRAFRRLAPFWA